jgi:hypothetical protein
VGGLRLREASEGQIREAARSEAQHLYRLEWRPVALSEAGPEAIPPTLIVGGDGELARRLGLERVDSIAALIARLDEGGTVPARVVFDHLAEPDGTILAATHAVAERALSALQAILSEARLNETSVAWLTCGAVATGPEEGAAGLSRAPLWGLVRSARAEHPERRLRLLDVDAPISEALAGEAVVDGNGRSWRSGMVRCWHADGACWVGRVCLRASHAGEPEGMC